MPSRRPEYHVIALVLVLGTTWAVFYLSLGQACLDFPLNDDWVYARTFFHFLHGEPLKYYNWPSMPQIGMWWMPWVLAKLFGPTHAALRLGTALFSIGGAAALYSLFRQCGVPVRHATFATLVFALSPLYFLCSVTFMTDVPSLAMALGAMAAYLSGVRQGRAWLLFAGGALATLAALTRQNAMVAPAVMLLFALQTPLGRLRRGPSFWAAFALPIVAGMAAHVWFTRFTDGMRFPMERPSAEGLTGSTFVALHYLAVLSAPVWFPSVRRADLRTPAFWVMLVLSTTLCCALYLKTGRTFPYLNNLMTAYGQFGLNDQYVGDRPAVIPAPVRLALTTLGAFGAALLGTRLFHALRAQPASVLLHPLALFTVFQFLPLLVAATFFDRYVITLLPGALLLLSPRTGAQASAAVAVLDNEARSRFTGQPIRALRRGVAAALSAAYTALSVSLAHDWLTWNAALWSLGRRTVASGVAPLDIDGGLEWNSWHASYDPSVYYRGVKDEMMDWHNLGRHAVEYPSPLPRRSMSGTLFGLDARHVLSFSPVSGTRTLDSEPYRLWLAPGRRALYLCAVPMEPGAPMHLTSRKR